MRKSKSIANNSNQLMTLIEFAQLNVNGNSFPLPAKSDMPITDTVYKKFKSLIEGAGGKYRDNAFHFDFDPKDVLASLANGEDYQQTTQFFGTTKKMVEHILQQDIIRPLMGGRILEPSAGRGALIDMIKLVPWMRECEIHACEIDETNRKILQEKGVKLIGDDFLKLRTTLDEKYDLIVMNPPFNGTEYIKHIEHAFDHLKPGGQLVFIAQTGWLKHTTKINAEFRDFIDSHAFHNEKLDKMFVESGTTIPVTLTALFRPLYDNEYLLPLVSSQQRDAVKVINLPQQEETEQNQISMVA